MSVITKLGLAVMVGTVVLSVPQAHATSLSPTVSDISVNQGGSAEQVFLLDHQENDVIEYSVELVGMQLGSGPDDVTFYELSDEVASWFTISNTFFAVAPGAIADITVSISPPTNTPSTVEVVGLQVVGLSRATGSVNIASGIIGIMFITVGDDVPSSGLLLDFSSSKTGLQLPATFHATFRNEGVRILQPEGTVTIKNMLGGTVIVLPLNEELRRIPGGQERTFSATWGEDSEQGFISQLRSEVGQLAVGFFSVELHAELWDGGDVVRDLITIFLFPWRFLLIFIAVLALLYGGVRLTRR